MRGHFETRRRSTLGRVIFLRTMGGVLLYVVRQITAVSGPSAAAFRAVTLFLSFFALNCAIACQADISTSTLKGSVTDQNGSFVSGALITVVNAERGISRTTVSDESGTYRLAFIPPGQYDIRINAIGFQTQVVKHIVLTVGQIAVRDIKLSVGVLNAQIEVKDPPILVETERTQQSDTIELRQIDSLPNLSRNFTSYVQTLPGVADISSARIQQTRVAPVPTSGFSFGGANGRSNYVSIDGGENESGVGSLRIRNLSVEAVQEFQVNRNAFLAEYGFTYGTAINVITRSGTNKFRGTGFLFYRSQATSARDPLIATGVEPFEQRIMPGFSFGGPISKDRAFIFTAYEALKYDVARIRTYTANPALLLPTGAQLSYLQSLESGPDSTVESRRIAVDLRLSLTTTNYPTTMTLLGQSEGQFTSPTRSHNWTTRIDLYHDESDLISGRFTLSKENNNVLGVDNVQAPSNAFIEALDDYTSVGSWTHIFSPEIVNQLRIQFANDHYRQISAAPESTLVRIVGLIDYGRVLTIPMAMDQNRFQFDDTVNWTRGPNDLKFGVSYRPVDATLTNELGFGGIFQFTAGQQLLRAVDPEDLPVLTGPLAPPSDTVLTSLQAFNLGIPSLWQQGFGRPTTNVWQHTLGIFGQTTWRVSPRLTLNIGARFDYNGEPEPLDQNASISPRIGFAWDLFGTGRTLLRGGFGTFYAPVSLQVISASTLQADNGEYLNLQSRSLADLGQSSQALWAYGVGIGRLPFFALSEEEIRDFGIIPAPGRPNRRIAAAADDYGNPYSVQASLGISQQLGRDLVVELSGQMYHGVHLPIAIEGNYRENGLMVPVPGMPGSDLFGPQLVRIDPTIAQKIVHSSEGNSIYYGLTSSLTKRFGDRYQFKASYTYSHAIDDVLDFTGASTPYVPTRRYIDRGRSAYDLRHFFVASGSFDTPFRSDGATNWIKKALSDITLSPIITLRSGFPFNLYIGRDINGDLNSTDRPFHAPRNSGIGENFYSVDFRLNKTFNLRRDSNGPRIEVIVEAINLFDRANYVRVNDIVCGTAAQPGSVNGCDPKFLTGPFDFRGIEGLPPTAPLAMAAAGPARQFQFGIKLEI